MRAALSLGANLGDREAALDAALDALQAESRLQLVGVSPVYETEPVGGPRQPPYLNAVVVVESAEFRTAGAFAAFLLSLGQAVEAARERTREVRWGPRTLDVDVLAVADLVSDDPVLTVPHPRIAERAFVLVPWAQVDPDFLVPGLGTVAELASALPKTATAVVRRR
jgi:2-amino-4-hydroxy-6-hydroxymethyldihydropteridine diphosphokinase